MTYGSCFLPPKESDVAVGETITTQWLRRESLRLCVRHGAEHKKGQWSDGPGQVTITTEFRLKPLEIASKAKRPTAEGKVLRHVSTLGLDGYLFPAP
ncbi:hypothetical protein J6590_015713 [Homalodisca vitripennis]|nr:hypothetical protein J6590_015713 [Homalodisca vitripennis]